MRLYLAAPLFTQAERIFNAMLAQELRAFGHKVWLPQDQEPRERAAADIFAMDVSGIDNSDLLVANMDGPDPDSGTSFECGYAFARLKPVIAFRTDLRGISDGGLAPFNIMLAVSPAALLQVPAMYPIALLARDLNRAIADLKSSVRA